MILEIKAAHNSYTREEVMTAMIMWCEIGDIDVFAFGTTGRNNTWSVTFTSKKIAEKVV